MKETLLVDLGGTLMLPEPRLKTYLAEARLSEASGEVQWDYVIQGVRSGTVVPRILDGVEDAVARLGQRYALSCFSDAHEEFKRLCLEGMPSIRMYFPDELIITNSAMSVGTKSSVLIWYDVLRYLTRRNHVPVACIDDEQEIVEHIAAASPDISLYHIDTKISRQPTRVKKKDLKEYWKVGNLSEMAEHFLSSR